MKKVVAQALLRAAASLEQQSQEAPEPSEAAAYSALVESVIAGIRQIDLPPGQRHEAIQQALEESGPSAEPWTEVFPESFATWETSMPEELASETGEAQCFRAGCLLPVRYASTEEYEAAAEAFRTIHDPDAPHGGRIMLPPRTGADGMVETGWIMLPPKLE